MGNEQSKTAGSAGTAGSQPPAQSAQSEEAQKQKQETQDREERQARENQDRQAKDRLKAEREGKVPPRPGSREGNETAKEGTSNEGNLGQPIADASGDQTENPNEPQSTYDETEVERLKKANEDKKEKEKNNPKPEHKTTV
jgi:hypothetical protein